MEATEDIQNIAQTQLDTGMAKSKPVQLGWKTREIEVITESLNLVLANYVIHDQKLRNYHWNVKGPSFFQLHQQFELQYNESRKNIDRLAERIRIFGKTPLSTLQDYLKRAEIKETSTDLPAEIMVREILSDYKILLDMLFSSVEKAREQQDFGTEEMLQKFISQLENNHWMFTSFLAK